MSSRSQCDTMSLWNSSSFLTLQNQEEKWIARQNPLLCFVWLVLQNTHKNSIVSPRDIADDPTSLVLSSKPPLWRQDDYMETTSRPDHLKIF